MLEEDKYRSAKLGVIMKQLHQEQQAELVKKLKTDSSMDKKRRLKDHVVTMSALKPDSQDRLIEESRRELQRMGRPTTSANIGQLLTEFMQAQTTIEEEALKYGKKTKTQSNDKLYKEFEHLLQQSAETQTTNPILISD